jgi:hypothetical protein
MHQSRRNSRKIQSGKMYEKSKGGVSYGIQPPNLIMPYSYDPYMSPYESHHKLMMMPEQHDHFIN